MKNVGASVLVCLVFIFYQVEVFSQTNPPSLVDVQLIESFGSGCHDTTNHLAGKICFDVNIRVDEPGWKLQSYNIWMDYGPNNNILTYSSDKSCVHVDGGDINYDIDGKYRFLAANMGLSLEVNNWVNFHNFCLDIVVFAGLKNLSVIPGGEHLGLLSSVNLVDQSNSANAINPTVEFGIPFEMESSSFLTIDPQANVACDLQYLHFTSQAVDATGASIVDCEPFIYLWLGPNGLQELQSNVSVPIVDSVAQSGLYELYVVGANGCNGYDSFILDVNTCMASYCHDSLVVQGPINLSNSRQARLEIVAQGEVLVSDSLAFNAPSIALEESFEVPLGVDFETLLVGCP